MNTAFQSIRLIHETEQRLRFRLPRLPGKTMDTAKIASILRAIPGIRKVRCNAHAQSIAIAFDPQKTSKESILKTMRSLGEHLPQITDSAALRSPQDTTRLLHLGLALAVMTVMPSSIRAFLAILVNTPKMATALKELFKKGLTGHVLESLAIGISMIRGHYGAATLTHFLIALEEYVGQSVQQQSKDLLVSLMKPSVQTARVEKEGGISLVEVAAIQEGDTVVISAGDMLPVDGYIINGMALVDESAITGQSTPVKKVRGDMILSGSVVQEGTLKIYARHVGDHTLMARVAQFIEKALGNEEAQTADRTRRIADTLAPVTVGLSALSFLATGSFKYAASILQVDYSGAIRLVIPIAFRAAMFEAGEHGVLAKGAPSIENLACADTFVFDRTGTLTEGKMTLEEVFIMDENWRREEILALAASIELYHSHPLTSAILSAALHDSFHRYHFEQIDPVIAHGVLAKLHGKSVAIGSRHFLEAHVGISFAPFDSFYHRLEQEGKALLFMAYDEKPLAIIVLDDRVRDDAKATLQRLRSLAVSETAMMTGNQAAPARRLGAELGMDKVYAELLPEEKAEIVQRMIKAGKTVAFVGDGVNDAPALLCAHVGISMAQGANVARASADLILLQDQISLVADTRAFALNTMHLVKSSLGIILGVNSAILGLATLGLLGPAATAILHNGTTIALLLRALKGPKWAGNRR